MHTTPRQHHSDDADLKDILQLIRNSFAYMDALIDPPSSMHKLRVDDIAEQCKTSEVWSMGEPIHACMVLTLKPTALYLGRLSISQQHQGCGLGTTMIEHALNRARLHGKKILEIKTRIELTDNHAFFNAQGFVKVSEHAHAGYDKPTYICMQLRC